MDGSNPTIDGKIHTFNMVTCIFECEYVSVCVCSVWFIHDKAITQAPQIQF